MSKIKAIYNLESSNWEVTLSDVDPFYTDLCVGFTDLITPIKFENLKFKYELKENGDIKYSDSFPKENVTYVSTDQEFIIIQRVYIQPEKNYELYLWAENANKSGETTTTFTTAIPESPYPSWTWDTEQKQWTPPVPQPSETIMHIWDEDNKQWYLP